MATTRQSPYYTMAPMTNAYQWGPTHSTDSEDTSVANNTSSHGSRSGSLRGGNSAGSLRGGGGGNNTRPSSRSGGWQMSNSRSNSMAAIDETKSTSAFTSATCHTFSSVLSLAPSTNTHQLGDDHHAGQAGCASDLRNLWNNAVTAFPVNDDASARNGDRVSGGSKGGQGGAKGGDKGGYNGGSILDYVTGCGRTDDVSSTPERKGRGSGSGSSGEYTEEEDEEGEEVYLGSPDGARSPPDGTPVRLGRSGRSGASLELSNQGMEIDQFGNARATTVSSSQQVRTPIKKKKKTITMRELAAGVGVGGGGVGGGTGGGEDSNTTPSPRDVRDLWRDERQRSQQQQQQQQGHHLEGQEQNHQFKKSSFELNTATSRSFHTKTSDGTYEQRTLTTAQTTSTGARAPSILRRHRTKKKNKSPRSAKYRLAETTYDGSGAPIPIDPNIADDATASSVDSFLNVEMLEANPAAELIDANGAYRHHMSIGGVGVKKKDAVGKYQHYDSIKVGGSGRAGGALADDLSLADDSNIKSGAAAPPPALSEQRQLYHRERVRTLGREYQRRHVEQRHHQHAVRRSTTAPATIAGNKARPSLARVTSGDEYDDNTALEEMRLVATVYREGSYADKPLPPPTEERKKKSKSHGDDDDRKNLPLVNIELTRQNVVELKRTVSELTMRSSYGDLMDGIDPNRRMAYYAVGRDGSANSKKRPGGNRRCYFTGRAIVGRNPFYAGTVQQGLRTLVVFCLPSAVGLPKSADVDAVTRRMEASALESIEALHKRENSGLTSFITEETNPDPNERMPPEILLEALPEPDKTVMKAIADTYADQYGTLPAQVQDPSCWKLYEKFCHFSGLPIAVGEVHYRVRPEIIIQSKLAKKLESKFGKNRKASNVKLGPSEEIILSHEVMLACNGEESSEIIRLPNKRCFRYLKKHYPHQCSKLADDVFDRSSWEMVRPEV